MPNFRSSCPPSFRKEVVAKGYGFNTPQDGSVCRIRVTADEQNLLKADLDESGEKEFVVGDVDEPVDRIVEDCIRTMKEEEECLLKFENPNLLLCSDTIIPSSGLDKGSQVPVAEEKGDDVPPDRIEHDNEGTTEQSSSVEIDSASQEEEEKASKVVEELVEIQFQLVSYTREPEIWEMSVTEKWRRASYHKQKGLELYSRGAYQYAFRRFGLTLKYVISLEHDIPSGQEEGMDIKGLKLSCYLNVAACQMRHYNFESVVINASKALELHPNNAKALYRRGAAYVQLQEYEKAKEDLTAAQLLEPKNQAVAKQLQLLRVQVQKLNQYYASAMKKLFQ